MRRLAPNLNVICGTAPRIQPSLEQAMAPTVYNGDLTRFFKEGSVSRSRHRKRTGALSDRLPATRPRRWQQGEDKKLREAVKIFKGKNWKAIAKKVPGRNHVQCLQRWKKVLKPGLVKGHWIKEEDELLRKLVLCGTTRNWGEVASRIPGRTAKQCRERWCYNLDPYIKKGEWTREEDAVLVEAQSRLGNRWARIAQLLPGRTENAVKTRIKSINRAKARAWTPEEDATLLRLRDELGNKRWDDIRKYLRSRTKNALKLRYRYLTNAAMSRTKAAISSDGASQAVAKPPDREIKPEAGTVMSGVDSFDAASEAGALVVPSTSPDLRQASTVEPCPSRMPQGSGCEATRAHSSSPGILIPVAFQPVCDVKKTNSSDLGACQADLVPVVISNHLPFLVNALIAGISLGQKSTTHPSIQSEAAVAGGESMHYKMGISSPPMPYASSSNTQRKAYRRNLPCNSSHMLSLDRFTNPSYRSRNVKQGTHRALGDPVVPVRTPLAREGCEVTPPSRTYLSAVEDSSGIDAQLKTLTDCDYDKLRMDFDGAIDDIFNYMSCTPKGRGSKLWSSLDSDEQAMDRLAM